MFSLNVLLKNDLIGGNILPTSLSILFTCSIAKLESAAFLASSAFFAKNIASGLPDVGLTMPAAVSIVLFILEELNAKSFPYCATLPIAFVPPYINGKYITESAPNLSLFNNFLPASSCGSCDSSKSNCVGPISKASPIVPIFSVSATNTSPVALPTTPAAKRFALALSLSL